MKKILNIMLLLAATALFSACRYEVDDAFDKSSAERASAAIENDFKVLTSVPNGWIMRYYGTTGYGGYNVYAKFNTDNTVTVQSEFFRPDENGDGLTTATSHFKVEQSAGVILSFDEYNPIFHYFSDPLNPDGIGAEGIGMGGDLEFRIVSATANEVVMTGKKHDARIVMVPAPDDFDWDAYVAQVDAVEKSYEFQQYGFVVDTDTIPVEVAYRCFYLTMKNEAGEPTEVDVPYTVVPEGLLFYKPIELGGKTVTGIKYVEDYDREDIEWSSFEEGIVRMIPVTPPLNQQFVDGRWFFSWSNLGEFALPYFNQAKDKLKAEDSEDPKGERFYYCYIGLDSRDKFGFAFASQGIQTKKSFIGSAYMNYELDGEDTIKLWFSDSYADDGKVYFINTGLKVIKPVFGTDSKSPRTFKLKADNVHNPKTITMTDVDEPTNVITLSSRTVYYPDEK